jgi:GNAT superfamily N-acetyltransferase
MPGKLIQRWTIGKGGFIGEVSLFALSEEDVYVRGNDTRTYVELSNLHIHPLRRAKGWGRELLSTALVHAQHRGWVVFIRAIPYNAGSLDLDCLMAFYKRYGFKSTRRDRREMLWHPK